MQMTADLDVFQDSQRLEELDELKRADEPAPCDALRREAGDVTAIECDAALGRRAKPEMTLNSVVLPAPFGPMIAVTPPADRDRYGVKRAQARRSAASPLRASGGSCVLLSLFAPSDARERGEPARRIDENEDQQGAVGEVLILAESTDGLRQ